MYDCINEWMAKTGISRKLPLPVLMNQEGQVITRSEESFGLPVEYELVHPDRLLFLDETAWM